VIHLCVCGGGGGHGEETTEKVKLYLCTVGVGGHNKKAIWKQDSAYCTHFMYTRFSNKVYTCECYQRMRSLSTVCRGWDYTAQNVMSGGPSDLPAEVSTQSLRNATPNVKCGKKNAQKNENRATICRNGGTVTYSRELERQASEWSQNSKATFREQKNETGNVNC
jgi:hypothetical protein